MEFCARLICWTSEGWPNSRRIGHKMSSWKDLSNCRKVRLESWGDMIPESWSTANQGKRTKQNEYSLMNLGSTHEFLNWCKWHHAKYCEMNLGSRLTEQHEGQRLWISKMEVHVSVLATRAPGLFMLQSRIIWSLRRMSHEIWRCSFIFEMRIMDCRACPRCMAVSSLCT